MNQDSIFKTRLLIIIVALILLVGAAYIWMAKSKSQGVPPNNLQAKNVPVLGRQHVDVGTKVEYNSNPPTSGDHYAVWTKSGIYDKPTEDGHLVHSLEHGYIVISHNCEIKSQISNLKSQKEGTESAKENKECVDFVNKLKNLVKKDSWKMILIPRPSLDTNFALTAWGKIDKFDIKDANMDRVNAFKESFRNHGPEQTME